MTAKVMTMAPRSILKRTDSTTPSTESKDKGELKKVFFDEILIKEFPIILGDNPAVSGGAPITIGWNPMKESVVDVDFYEYCRCSERKHRKKLILSVRRRAGFLLSSGYSIEEIAYATMEVEKTKQERADSLKKAGWSNPFDLLSGAVETTGAALRRADVLGVGAVVGAGVQGVNTVVGVGADVTVQTGRFLVSGAKSSTRVMIGVSNEIAGGVVGAGKAVAKPMVGAGKTLVVKPVVVTGKVIGSGITQTGKAVGSVVTSTGRALSLIVKPLSSESSTKDLVGTKRSPVMGHKQKRRNSDGGGVAPTPTSSAISDFTAIDVQ